MKDERLLSTIAWKFAQQYHADFKDLMQEASIAYLEAIRTHDETKGMLTTHLWHVVFNHLKNYLKQEEGYKCQKTGNELCYDTEIETSHENIFDRLSNDARNIVDVLVSAPDEFICMAKEEAQVLLFKKLLDKKVPEQKIIAGFSEIFKLYA
jgi:DNA-directed RNA polymerase specialized sigma subunit